MPTLCMSSYFQYFCFRKKIVFQKSIRLVIKMVYHQPPKYTKSAISNLWYAGSLYGYLKYQTVWNKIIAKGICVRPLLLNLLYVNNINNKANKTYPNNTEPPAMMIFVPIMLQVGLSLGRLREKTLRNVNFLMSNIRQSVVMVKSDVWPPMMNAKLPA